MRMTKRQLSEVITDYLLSEAEFGSFRGSVDIEFCDLSGLPKIFTAIFEPIRDRDSSKLKLALSEELEKAEASRDKRRIEKLSARISELEDENYWSGSDAFAGIFGSATFMGLTKILGPGLTMMTMMTKVDCDHIINLVNIFTVNILAPLLGIEGAQLQELEDEIKRNKGERVTSSEGEAQNQSNMYSDDMQVKIFNSVSNVFKDNNLLNYEKRDEARVSGKLRLNDYDGKITDMHLDFFELFSPVEYLKFLEDPREDIPESAKDNFLNAIKILEDQGHRDFGSFINAFVLATPGTRTDSAVAKILKAANLKNYFKEPKDAIKFVKTTFNTMYKEFEFDGFQLFGL